MPPPIALVVGAAGGIGKALSRKLASRGLNVVIADLNADEAFTSAESLKRDFEVQACSVQVDVSQEKEVIDMVSFASSWNSGGLDYAANCAGICENIWGDEKNLSTELFDKTFAINARGLWLCQKYEAQQMQKQEPREPKFAPSAPHPIPGQRGAIANIASISGLHANGLAAYTASKYAAVGITKNGAKFYGPDGIRCNAICPGWTLTAMIERSMGREGTIGTQENRDSEVSRKIALRRMAFAEEQANVLSFLLSDESSYLNGSLIVSDGGFHDIR